MPNHVSAPALTPSAPLGDAPGVDPTALPPVTGNGPQSPSTADAFGATGSAPNVMDELRESVGAASARGEALADRAAEEVFGSEDNARDTAGRLTSFVASWERHEHEKPSAVWLTDEFSGIPTFGPAGRGPTPRGASRTSWTRAMSIGSSARRARNHSRAGQAMALCTRRSGHTQTHLGRATKDRP